MNIGKEAGRFITKSQEKVNEETEVGTLVGLWG